MSGTQTNKGACARVHCSGDIRLVVWQLAHSTDRTPPESSGG